MYAIGVIGRLNGWKRYDRDTYLEMDITDLPPGEVMQIGWNGFLMYKLGIPVFIRRLTAEEVKHENESPVESLLDKSKEVFYYNLKGCINRRRKY